MRLTRLAPLAGIVFVVITVVLFTTGPNEPGIKSSPAKIAAFWAKHQSEAQVGGFVLAIAMVFFVIFLASLWRALRASEAPPALWSGVALVGGVILATAFLVAGMIHLTLGDAGHHHVTPTAMQALNAINEDDYIPIGAGAGLLMLGSAGAILAAGALPRWLGWVALVLGIAAFTPAGFFAFLLTGLWILVASVLLYQRPVRPSAGEPPATASPPPAERPIAA